MTVMDPKQMNVAAAVWAVVAYVVADMEEMLPRSWGEQEERPLSSLAGDPGFVSSRYLFSQNSVIHLIYRAQLFYTFC